MKPSSQIAILKTIVMSQAEEIEVLQRLVEHLETDRNILELVGSIQGDTETLTVTVPPAWEIDHGRSYTPENDPNLAKYNGGKWEDADEPTTVA